MTTNVLTNARAWTARLSRRTRLLGAGGAPARARHDVHRFDGERAFVTRGGATIGDVKASWSLVELSISSTTVTLRSRPRGLFDDVCIDRDDVESIGAQRSEMGTGITFGDARPDVVFWPTDVREVLVGLRDRGWPVAGSR
ncbi:MAG: hypothetical protein R6X23_14115 [Acidimicrobiia bacterium]